jgi:hypothetical protein
VPSSILFAALAAAWLVVLVPMFARRRQEVSRTTDTALAARVVRRGSDRIAASSGASRTDVGEEAVAMPETDRDGAADAVEQGSDEEHLDEGQWRRVHSDDVRAGRRYRPGRGGFDPEAAALAARAKYARRQRIVLFMLLAAVTTAAVAGFLWPLAWWAHGAVDLTLAGYLTYLRRQVRIEEDVRSRRLARLSAGYEGEPYGQDDWANQDEHGVSETDNVEEGDAEEGGTEPQQSRPTAQTRPAGNAVVVEIDDEDPMFDELDERLWMPYRRAVGE